MASRLAEARAYFAHPTVFVLIALAAGLVVAFRDALLTPVGAAALLAGVLLLVPQEYVAHRFVLHARPFRNKVLRRMQDRLHYGHHENPDDLDLLFGPLWGVLPTAIMFWLFFLAATRDVALASVVAAGNVAAYAYYEWTHFVAHRPITPLTRWGRRVKAMHLWHHHKNEHYWFGVTTRAVDLVAGTHPDVHAVERSATTRELARSRP